jgi:large repetitive protein
MYGPDQHFVANHSVTLHGPTGATLGTFTFPDDLPGPSVSQQTILVGDDGVEAAFGVKPDLENSAFNIPAAAGAACWEGLDCVSWGNFTGTTSPSSGVPADPPGIPDGFALGRLITGGACANRLDGQDDTDDSERDFANATPSPQSYTTVPTPPDCTAPLPTPVTVIDDKPASPTASTSASFTFHASPLADDFECRLDLGAYADCDPGVTYSPLAEGIHIFRVRGSNANGIGAPVSYSWKVDVTAPSASISSHPIDPSPGKSASFRYGSNESGSKFECRLEPLEVTFAACNTQPKVYSDLADGKYEFLVRAIDAAGNVQSVPTPFPWTVDNSLEDKTAPETTINSKPADPSSSPVATFTYSSNEAGSSFQCKLDGGNFNSCPVGGITYSGLTEAAHTFQVRATDTSNNTDPSPAGYSFSIVLAAPAPAGILAPAILPVLKPSKPNTTIAKASAKTHDRTPTFRLGSSQSGAKFQCKLDGGPFAACRSPFTTKKLGYGKHVLQVRAVLGLVGDPTPAKLNFTVVKA